MILSKLCQTKIEPFDKCKHDHRELLLTTVNIQQENVISLPCITNVRDIQNLLLATKNNTGIDGFTFQWGDDNTWHAHILQIKCGNFNLSIKKGTAKSTDASIYFTAILKKAEQGWKTLKEQFEVKLSICFF